jgi:phosphoribosylanthranilate isomerase
MPTWIKACGTTNLEDAECCCRAGVDALGFVFTESPRRLDAEAAAAIIAGLSTQVERIGVFVNEPLDSLLSTAETAGLSGVQLHGEESPFYVAQLRQREPALKVIKAISAEIARYKGLDYFIGGEDLVDAIMVDSGTSRIRGGTGKPFDWLGISNFIMELQNRCPVIIAGGLNPENVKAALVLLQPNGLDVVSGLEASPGRKDRQKVERFVQAVRSMEPANSPK